VSPDRPINADVPVAGEPAPATKPKPRPTGEKKQSEPATKPSSPAPPRPQGRRRSRKPIPGALKGIFALVAVAILFIVVAVIGGSGGSPDSSDNLAPAPAPTQAPSDEESAGTAASETAEQLGYPAFATANTTRVGGPDPAANAAGVALATFPATTPAQRPTAVTLVDADDWAGGLAAAVLVSEPVRAPILISAADELPEPTTAALNLLDPQGAPETGGAATFAIGDVIAPDGKTTAVKAGSAAATAAAIARLRDRLFGSDPAHIVLAPSGSPALAMPAAAWAARSGDPILFAAGDRLPKPTAATLKRHDDVPVYVLGPSSAISSKAIRAVSEIGNEVHRVSGEDPIANAIAFARYADGEFGWNINDPGHGFVLARDDSPLTAAAAAPLSAAGTWGPLLLTDSATSLPGPLREYFLDVKPGYTTNPTRAFYNHVWVIGDQEAIDVNQQAEVNELAALAKIGSAP